MICPTPLPQNTFTSVQINQSINASAKENCRSKSIVVYGRDSRKLLNYILVWGTKLKLQIHVETDPFLTMCC